MSGEFRTEYTENAIGAAIENMERNMRNFKYVGEYVQEIQETYADYPEGKTELLRMIRAAQLITHRKSGDMSEEVQAVYHGELLGLELINYLEPDTGKFFKTGYAQSFFKFHTEKDRPPYTEPLESGLQQQARFGRLSESLKEELSFPIYAHGLNPIYEEFGQKATSKLSDEIPYQDLAMMGFRMIVTEALNPSVNSTTGELLEEYKAPELAPMPPVSIASLTRDYARSINKTEEIIGNQEGIHFAEWEDISWVRTELYKQFLRITTAEVEPPLSSASTLEEIEQYEEAELTAFNQENELISTHDLLSVRGEFFASPSTESDIDIYDKNTEVRGYFDGLEMVTVPSKRELAKAFEENIEEGKKHINNLVHTVAIRIANPVFIVVTTDGEEIIEHTENETISIPLNYKNIAFSRIKAEELEPEA